MYDLEEMASHIFAKQLGQEIVCNFRNKCWSALLKWPSTIEGFMHIFDRTDTTHKMSAATTSYIKIEDYASSYIRRLMSFKGVIVGCLSAMANSKEYISRYIAEMKDLGVNESYIKVGQDSYSKPEGKLLELKRACNSSGVCFYGDGYNDSQIMANSNVLGVGVQYETIDLTVKKRATCVIPDFKNTKIALPLILEMQKLASTLLLYAVCSNVFLMLLHPMIYIIYGTLFPTWGTCAATIGVGAGLKIKTHLLCSRLSTELAESYSSQRITKGKAPSRTDYEGMIPAPVNS